MKKKWSRMLAMLTGCSLAAGMWSSVQVFGAAKLPKLEAANQYTGYMLCNAASGTYLTVANAQAQDGANVCTYQADGAAAYNTWYLTELEDGGYSLKSALDQGQYYLNLEQGASIAQTPTSFQLAARADGSYQLGTQAGTVLSCTSSALYGAPVEQQAPSDSLQEAWILKPVTGTLVAGDWNWDKRLSGLDLAYVKRLQQMEMQFDSYVLDFWEIAICDTNGDGAFTLADVVTLQRYLLGDDTAAYQAAVAIPSCTIFPQMQELTTTVQETTSVESSTTTTTTTTTTTPVTSASPAETTTTTTAQPITIADLPSDYQAGADWIWENRIQRENSTGRQNTIFDQIVAGNGTLNYVVRWQSYRQLTLQQRQQMEQMLSDCVNGWTDWLVGYENWPYQHVTVKIVGWAVLDRSCLLDLQEDEVVYDTLMEPYDSSGDTSNGVEEIPSTLPSAPDDISRFYHFSTGIGYDYPNGLDSRFDMYLWATQGWPSIGGCGGDWGQRLSDAAYLNMLDGTGLHVLEHEIGHGFGMTDFYGGEGASDGFPPGGFPGGENSLMMAGSAMKITDFDGWMLRYMWSKLSQESGRFAF